MADKYDAFLDDDARYDEFLDETRPAVQPRFTPEQIAAHAKKSQRTLQTKEGDYLDRIAANPLVRGMLGTATIPRSMLEMLPGEAGQYFRESESNIKQMQARGKAQQSGLMQGIGATTEFAGEVAPWFAAAPVMPFLEGAGAMKYLGNVGLGAGYGSLGGALTTTGDIAEPTGTRLERAGYGAMLGGAIPAALQVISKVGGGLIDLAKGDIGKITASKILRDAVGTGKTAFEKALTAAKSKNVTVGQAVQDVGGIGRDEVLALAKLAESKGNPNTIRAQAEAATQSLKAKLAKISGGKTEEKARISVQQAKDALNGRLDPLRVSGSEEINKKTNYFVGLGKHIAALRDVAARKIESANIAIDAASRARTMKWLPQYAKEKTGAAMGASLEAGAASSKLAQAELSLADEQAKGFANLSAKPLIDKIDTILATPGKRATPVVEKTMTGLKSYIAKFTDENGNIDAYDLHSMRKNANEIAEMILGDASEGTKKHAASLIRSLRGTMDEGIKAAGGDDLIRYFDQYSKGMQKINQMTMASKLQGMSTDEMLKTVRGDKTELVEQVFGPGSFKFATQMGKSAKEVEEVARQLGRNIRISEIGGAEAAQSSLANIITKDTIKFRFPPMISAKITAANQALNFAESRLSEKARTVLFRAMESPRLAMDLINTLPASERMMALKIMKDAQKLQAMAGAAGAAAGINKEQQ